MCARLKLFWNLLWSSARVLTIVSLENDPLSTGCVVSRKLKRSEVHAEFVSNLKINEPFKISGGTLLD